LKNAAYQVSADQSGFGFSAAFFAIIKKAPQVAFIADEMRRTDFGRAHSADRKRMAAGYRAQAPAY